jgi:uncharacterized protein YlxP (DUF503 family)
MVSDDSAYVGFLKVHLHFPEAGSLKGKRAELNRIKAWLREREGASVSEIGHHDSWQRSTLAVAVVSESYARCANAADHVARRLGPWDPRIEQRILSWADTEAIG